MSSLTEAITVGDQKTPYWQEIADLRRELSEIALTSSSGKKYVYITSLTDRYRGRVGGVTCEATIDIAARQIGRHGHGGPSHRLATDDEIQKFHADQKDRKAILDREADANKSVTIVRVEGVKNADGSMDLKPLNNDPSGDHDQNQNQNQPAARGNRGGGNR